MNFCKNKIRYLTMEGSFYLGREVAKSNIRLQQSLEPSIIAMQSKKKLN